MSLPFSDPAEEQEEPQQRLVPSSTQWEPIAHADPPDPEDPLATRDEPVVEIAENPIRKTILFEKDRGQPDVVLFQKKAPAEPLHPAFPPDSFVHPAEVDYLHLDDLDSDEEEEGCDLPGQGEDGLEDTFTFHGSDEVVRGRLHAEQHDDLDDGHLVSDDDDDSSCVELPGDNIAMTRPPQRGEEQIESESEDDDYRHDVEVEPSPRDVTSETPSTPSKPVAASSCWSILWHSFRNFRQRVLRVICCSCLNLKNPSTEETIRMIPRVVCRWLLFAVGMCLVIYLAAWSRRPRNGEVPPRVVELEQRTDEVEENVEWLKKFRNKTSSVWMPQMEKNAVEAVVCGLDEEFNWTVGESEDEVRNSFNTTSLDDYMISRSVYDQLAGWNHNYALASYGAEVVATSGLIQDETCSSSSSIILQNRRFVDPGSCLLLEGRVGEVTIGLPRPIRVSCMSLTGLSAQHLEELPKDEYESTSVQDFILWGAEEAKKGSSGTTRGWLGRLRASTWYEGLRTIFWGGSSVVKHAREQQVVPVAELGSWTYNTSIGGLQRFCVETDCEKEFRFYRIGVVSNHGNEEKTRLYRIGLYGGGMEEKGLRGESRSL